MHIELRYVTRFVYPSPVWDSHNALRARPADEPHQRVISYSVRTSPPARLFTYTDNWGTQVDEFSVADEHTELVVDARASVETDPRPQPDRTTPVSALSAPSFREQYWTFLRPSRHVAWTDEMEQTATDLVGKADDVAAGAHSIASFVTGRLSYQPGTTEVGTPITTVWDTRLGVCQDFTHLAIGMLRAASIPARYVSGYLYAQDPASSDFDDQEEVVVQTHAWVEAAIPGFGWWAIDPTNDTPAGERHVTIGRGRDYEDVMPLRGVYHGDAEAKLAAEVTMSQTVVSERLPDVPFDQ
ncbi:MAG: transglutaminase family protein [Acidimicrobiia bacterium]|nr:transglutaminase family protein [Acidimicrobiia bacterium]